MDNAKIARSCAFTGHRPNLLPWGYDETDSRCIQLKKILREYIVYMIENKKVNHFISGMAQGVDTYVAQIILKLKHRYDITLECAIPCATQTKGWTDNAISEYEKIKNLADMVSYIRKEYTVSCMAERNIYMVNRAKYLIAVFGGGKSGTLNTIQYAKELQREIVVINPNTFKMYKYSHG